MAGPSEYVCTAGKCGHQPVGQWRVFFCRCPARGGADTVAADISVHFFDGLLQADSVSLDGQRAVLTDPPVDMGDQCVSCLRKREV